MPCRRGAQHPGAVVFEGPCDGAHIEPGIHGRVLEPAMIQHVPDHRQVLPMASKPRGTRPSEIVHRDIGQTGGRADPLPGIENF